MNERRRSASARVMKVGATYAIHVILNYAFISKNSYSFMLLALENITINLFLSFQVNYTST